MKAMSFKRDFRSENTSCELVKHFLENRTFFLLMLTRTGGPIPVNLKKIAVIVFLPGRFFLN